MSTDEKQLRGCKVESTSDGSLTTQEDALYDDDDRNYVGYFQKMGQCEWKFPPYPRDYLEEKDRLVEIYDNSSDEDDITEKIDADAEFINCPECVPAEDTLQLLGDVQGTGIENMAIVKPHSCDLIVDIGTFVVEPASRRICGCVWDVFGQVSSPMYTILMRPGCSDIFKDGLSLMYSQSTAKYVSTETLMQERGLDADSDSGCEFSDDEAERLHRRGKEQGEL